MHQTSTDGDRDNTKYVQNLSTHNWLTRSSNVLVTPALSKTHSFLRFAVLCLILITVRVFLKNNIPY